MILQTCKLKQDTYMYTKVSMSMGGPFVALFCVTYVSQEWKDAHIFQFISMSGVYGGSSSPLNTLFSGACMHLCMHGCTYACMYACMHACMCVCMYPGMHAYTFLRTYHPTRLTHREVGRFDSFISATVVERHGANHRGCLALTYTNI